MMGIQAFHKRRRWAPLLGVALLLALTLVFFWRLALSGLILGRGDTFLYFYPYWQAAASALRAGRVALWNTQIFMGAPFLANSQVGFLYPLNWPLWLLLPTPYAVSAGIVLHVMLAAVGSYMLARRQTGLSVAGAVLAAVCFALGGYLTAQAEHVNQLQGLAWLPWLLAVAGGKVSFSGRRGLIITVMLAGAILAMQLLAGHTQSLFISGVALVVFRVVNKDWRHYEQESVTNSAPGWVARSLLAVLAVPLLSLAVAALMAAVQLLPTLELAQLSGRGRGLPVNEVLSFSLHPLLLPQALLPRYGQTTFTEYVALLPITALLLAGAGGWQWRWVRAARGPLALALSGLFLALGRFNLLYFVLAQIPGFNYFRAPARWLAIYALGMALLAGLGLDMLRGIHGPPLSLRTRRGLLWTVGLILALMALSFVAALMAGYIPVGQEAPVLGPSWQQLGAWLAELALAGWITYQLPRARHGQRQPLVLVTGAVVVVALFFASRSLPYNQLTAPAAYADVRPPIARLQAMQRCDLLPEACLTALGRLLSLSETFFDPGDLPELHTVYGDWLLEAGFYDLVIATKQKEIVAPNLPMAYGLASVDGFDGGVLPLRNYSELMRLILPEGGEASDGRLREYLDDIPEARWLDLFGARYVITDKVGDEWRRDVFFDTQHAQIVAPGVPVTVGYIPQYVATELWLLADDTAGAVTVVSEEGNEWLLEPETVEDGLQRVTFPRPLIASGLTIDATEQAYTLRALALVDSRDGSFQSLTPGNYRLIYSGDVKIYGNLDVFPRAFLVARWQWQPDVPASVAAMASPDFDPGREAVLIGQNTSERGNGQIAGQATIVIYTSEEVVVQVSNEARALLVLTDAHYPGWRATIDGEAVKIEQVDGLFRGVFVPDGEHEVRFEFWPQSYHVGRWVTIGSVMMWLGGMVLLSVHRKRRAGAG